MPPAPLPDALFPIALCRPPNTGVAIVATRPVRSTPGAARASGNAARPARARGASRTAVACSAAAGACPHFTGCHIDERTAIDEDVVGSADRKRSRAKHLDCIRSDVEVPLNRNHSEVAFMEEVVEVRVVKRTRDAVHGHAEGVRVDGD